jgi:phosphatidylserine/phosphatidylglycerophosphate/cardiolipin synthase-like enzyme
MPDISQKDMLVQEIVSAQKRIWIEIYTWTEKDTLSAVIDAYHR